MLLADLTRHTEPQSNNRTIEHSRIVGELHERWRCFPFSGCDSILLAMDLRDNSAKKKNHNLRTIVGEKATSIVARVIKKKLQTRYRMADHLYSRIVHRLKSACSSGSKTLLWAVRVLLIY